VRLSWAGTFHSVANRLLRIHANSVGLDPAFTVLDRADSEDLLDLLREERGLANRASRFPRKGTCLEIYSNVVNSRRPLPEALEKTFPWCREWAEELRGLFAAYAGAKERNRSLDYDDLLLYWRHLMDEPALAARVRERFDHVLVDEYQDTNALQAEVLLALDPRGAGLTVVGDDAQAIYSFRAATVKNILEFPSLFDPPAKVLTLETNYRSTQPILAAANAVVRLARERYAKELHSSRQSDAAPRLVLVGDENEQAEYVAGAVLEHRETGVPLRRQAVLFRAAHHSNLLEVELSRRNIPFVKFGGLRFLEAAHVKDFLAVLRWAENPRDALAAFRVLQILPGFGPANARRALAHLDEAGHDLAALGTFRPPKAAGADWPAFRDLMTGLRDVSAGWHDQPARVRRWYRPHLERIHESPEVRAADLEHLEILAARYATRERFLTELILDPPGATGDEAGVPLRDEDYLILSTIHSAKGQEWDVVFVLSVVDGAIPSDMATGSAEEIEEERRLLYVAMTRARDALHLVQPLRYYVRQQHRHGPRHVYAPRSRFLPDSILDRFERVSWGPPRPAEGAPEDAAGPRIDIGARLRRMWES
ncbi:MAG: ATP-dependent helicase, partial [Planctomycetes bacterium]|nr:ATP-dependent helicase [Planctomycetota bacterium]